ncbi:hypothetical protein QTO34_013093 [Cnephaeus nilssonii]|uniref:Uncharacterized protein n=1 Tax=Cnephaeus nilssonii TaxID=3371016 RepID=A0AA40HA31_CNENI|nr:hypothetical protein QTO34_013093 [Eptesicus nilssonii]
MCSNQGRRSVLEPTDVALTRKEIRDPSVRRGAVPRVKDKVNNDYLTDDEIIWEKFTPDMGKGDHEEVFRVEEIEESTAKV